VFLLSFCRFLKSRYFNKINLHEAANQPTGCAAECAVRSEPVCANTGFFRYLNKSASVRAWFWVSGCFRYMIAPTVQMSVREIFRGSGLDSPCNGANIR
jgi:hypothetical protein